MPLPRTFEELGEATRTREKRERDAIERDQLIDSIKEHEAQVAQDLAVMRHAFEPDAPFYPTPKLRAQIISDFLNDITLEAMADKAKTTLEQLALWIAREEIDKSVAAIEHAMERKLRLRSLSKAERALSTASAVLDSYIDYESYLPPATGDSKQIANTLRNREGATKASNTILRVVRQTDPRRQSRRAQAPGAERTPTSDAPIAPSLPSTTPFTNTPPIIVGSEHAQQLPPREPTPQLPQSPTNPDAPSQLSNLKFQICDSDPHPAPANLTHPTSHIPHPTSHAPNPQSLHPNPPPNLHPKSHRDHREPGRHEPDEPHHHQPVPQHPLPSQHPPRQIHDAKDEHHPRPDRRPAMPALPEHDTHQHQPEPPRRAHRQEHRPPNPTPDLRPDDPARTLTPTLRTPHDNRPGP